MTDCDLPSGQCQELHDKFLEAANSFQEVNEIVQSRLQLSSTEIDNYQRKADRFYLLWVELNGREGVTNYVHEIFTHFRQFLLIDGNLYKYSQQGWEHHNKRMLGIYHRHTQKGGNGAKDEQVGHIHPLFRHKAWCWMWKTNRGILF